MLLLQAYRDHLSSNLHQRNAGSFVSQQQQQQQQTIGSSGAGPSNESNNSQQQGIKRQAAATESSSAAVVDVDSKDVAAAATKRPKKERAKALPGEDEPEFDENLLVLDWCKLLLLLWHFIYQLYMYI